MKKKILWLCNCLIYIKQLYLKTTQKVTELGSLGVLLFVPKGFTRKLKLIFLSVIAIIFVLGWLYTDGGNIFKGRMEKFDSIHKMVNYHLPETERYLSRIDLLT